MIFNVKRVLALLCAGLLTAACVAGCAPQSDPEAEQQAANRGYMSAVNQAVSDLEERLAGFEEAVARGDAVTMRTQADNAFKALDALGAIEAPEAFADIQAGYLEGCEALEEALASYITLYTEIESATEGHPFDYSSYETRLADIQALYDDGIEQLSAADAAATELP